MALHAVIMAGGIGSRFWPRSRRSHPKQFLDVFGDTSLIQNTFARLQPLVASENVLVVTNAAYVEKTQQHLPAVPAANILGEPVARNTAPCIALAAAKLLAEDPDATMLVLPADHLIANVQRFHTVLRVAVEAAQGDGDGPAPLVTIGIRPTHPETGYGYIQFDADGDLDGVADDGPADAPRAHEVLTFAEKPDLQTAERFLDAGDFLWNSGMFIWRADAILAANRYGYRISGTHTFGDKGFMMILDAYNEANDENAIGGRRFSLDHGLMVSPEVLEGAKNSMDEALGD